MDVDKLSAELAATGAAYLAALRKAATDSKLPILATMADAFERQHVRWVPQRLASLKAAADEAAAAKTEG